MFLKVDLLGQDGDSVPAFGERSDWFSQRLRHCTFPSAGCGDSSSSTPSPTLVDNIRLFYYRHPIFKGFICSRKQHQDVFWDRLHHVGLPCLWCFPCKSQGSHRFSPSFLWDRAGSQRLVRPCCSRSVFLRNVQTLRRSGCEATPSAPLHPDAAAAEKPGPGKERN